MHRFNFFFALLLNKSVLHSRQTLHQCHRKRKYYLPCTQVSLKTSTQLATLKDHTPVVQMKAEFKALLLPLLRRPACSWETPFLHKGTRDSVNPQSRRVSAVPANPWHELLNSERGIAPPDEKEECRKSCFPACEIRACASCLSNYI